MSLNITMSCIDKLKTETLLDSLFDGSFQIRAHKRIPELLEALEKYSPMTEEELYMPKFNTPEAKQIILERLNKRSMLLGELEPYAWIPDHIKGVNELKNAEKNEDYDDAVRSLVIDVVSLNSESAYFSAWEMELCADLLFKLIGLKQERDEYIEKISLKTWSRIFNNLSPDILTAIKNEIIANKDEYGIFEDFEQLTNDMRHIVGMCDDVNMLFSVTIEGEGVSQYETSLEERVKEFLKTKSIDPINIESGISAFFE